MADGATPTGGRPATKTIDLDAARRARAEKLGEAPVIRFLEKDWILPRELPAIAAHAFAEIVTSKVDVTNIGPDEAVAVMGLMGGAIESLFGGQWASIVAAAEASGWPLSFTDETFLIEQAFAAYGIDLPESPPSGSS